LNYTPHSVTKGLTLSCVCIYSTLYRAKKSEINFTYETVAYRDQNTDTKLFSRGIHRPIYELLRMSSLSVDSGYRMRSPLISDVTYVLLLLPLPSRLCFLSVLVG